MLNILETPAEFRQVSSPYPSHSTGPTIESAAYSHLSQHRHRINSSLTYLPIFWQANYFADRRKKRTQDYGAVPEVQQWLDQHLDPSVNYFTISQADEGTYERLPSNVMVFSGGGTGQVALPLLCDHHTPIQAERTIFASFIGTIETGGPATSATKPTRSSWNVNGAGATLRRAMYRAFSATPNVIIETTIKSSAAAATQRFIELACKSRFSLAPRGYGRTSFRLYETMQLGAVPVYIYDDCWLPYMDQINWESFAVLCHLSELPGLPARLASITDNELAGYQKTARDLFPNYFTIAGMCQQLERYITERPFNDPV